MATPKPPPKYVVLGHSDYQRLVQGIRKAPVARLITDPWIQILSESVGPLPARMNKPFELSVKKAGGSINSPAAGPTKKTAAKKTSKKTAKKTAKPKKGKRRAR